MIHLSSNNIPKKNMQVKEVQAIIMKNKQIMKRTKIKKESGCGESYNAIEFHEIYMERQGSSKKLHKTTIPRRIWKVCKQILLCMIEIIVGRRNMCL